MKTTHGHIAFIAAIQYSKSETFTPTFAAWRSAAPII
jgi:hypothetical protein